MAGFEVDLDNLLEECQRKLPAAEFAVLQQNRQKLLHNQLVTPNIIRAATYEQLCAATLSPGAALALKAVFPSAGACCGLAAAILSVEMGTWGMEYQLQADQHPWRGVVLRAAIHWYRQHPAGGHSRISTCVYSNAALVSVLLLACLLFLSIPRTAACCTPALLCPRLLASPLCWPPAT
jgi:hypothetical protein